MSSLKSRVEYFPPMPMEKEFRMDWIRKILNGKLLNDKDIAKERETIRQLLAVLSGPITL